MLPAIGFDSTQSPLLAGADQFPQPPHAVGCSPLVGPKTRLNWAPSAWPGTPRRHNLRRLPPRLRVSHAREATSIYQLLHAAENVLRDASAARAGPC